MSQHIQKDSTGKDWIMWKQEQFNSCGPACIYMVSCLASRQTKIGGEKYIRDLISKYGVTFWDLALPSGSGSNILQLSKVLRDLGFRVDSNNLSPKDLKSLTLVANEQKPAILHVSWNPAPNGGHFVLCVGKKNSNIIILDPFYGLREVASLNFPKYIPAQQCSPSGETLTGEFSGWYSRLI
jgi:ABC-type bacteriocin/lantibiotic exporter with double-glycine peptidase domain